VVQSIKEYSAAPRIPECCGGPAERFLSVVPVSAGANVLHGDRHYDGLRAPDGTDISTRSKHREFMKRTGLTLADDFKGQWAKQRKDREETLTGKKKDPELRKTLEKELYRRLP
jgi:hypothetical protein